MVKRTESKRYINLEHHADESTAWYWRFIAMAASWMILAGYLILPGLYTRDISGEGSQLRFSEAVLSVFVVALLTAGYSFTALLCFACRNEIFQAESIFLPALTSSALGLIAIAYNFLSSRAYIWNTAAISATVISATSTVMYACLLLWTHRRIVQLKEQASQRSNLWSEQSYYSNYVANMYPTASRSPSTAPEPPLSEDDRINQQMALLLMNKEPNPSPDASSATFRIDLPEDSEERAQENRQELNGTLTQAQPTHWTPSRTGSRPDSLGETQAWSLWQDRGRAPNRPSSAGGRSNHSRGPSREERRREIELGRYHHP
ncbi:hypothetical protein DM02DRAFT_518030 [Periconia macrospinosa]|uniref:Uncharacterized protein n=1 Tax=Periconia macrospinosa TaxID=97972 RepID=A0A2V1E3Q4_9PLEO|nr:hypothetical protein DM02DRAFT_518030 [Periconia macrospinosa]